MADPFDIFIVSVSWNTGSKNRPVLVLSLDKEKILVFPITTQYEKKSDVIKARYCRINNWNNAGLVKPSYIDTGTLIRLPVIAIKNKKPVGKLTVADKKNLLAFLTK